LYNDLRLILQFFPGGEHHTTKKNSNTIDLEITAIKDYLGSVDLIKQAELKIQEHSQNIGNIKEKDDQRNQSLENFTKRYEEETNLRCHIIIDNSSSMHFPLKDKVSFDNLNKIGFSIYAAAALIQLLKKQRDAFGLSVFSDRIDFSSKERSTNVHAKYVYTELEKMLVPQDVNSQKLTFATESLHTAAEMIHKRSLVIIFSDMFEKARDPDKLFSALQHLRHNKHEVILFHVVQANTELDFRYENRPTRFVDLESGEEMKLNLLKKLKEIY